MMANRLYIDIETIPTPEAWQEACAKENLQQSEEGATDEEAKNKLSFSACTAKILCLGYASNSDPADVVYHSEEEYILKTFWNLARQANLFIGHNIMDFDLRFIWQRSIILGVRPTRDIPFIRFRQAPIYDTMQEWGKWNFQGKVNLDLLCRALGIASSKAGGIDGSKVFEYYNKGRIEEILDYCKADVECVRQIYQRLTA